MADKKFYLTEQGFKCIKKEYDDLRKIRAAKIKGEVPQLLHSEDLNPEYLSFQEDIDLLETRIEELKEVFESAEIIKAPPKSKQNTIGFGAKIAVEVEGEIDNFMIVGTLEANPALGRISNESPVGRALLGRKIGDEVVISSPVKTTYIVKKISYGS